MDIQKLHKAPFSADPNASELAKRCQCVALNNYSQKNEKNNTEFGTCCRMIANSVQKDHAKVWGLGNMRI